ASRDATFAAIALPLLPDVARVARALTREQSDADDLVQETFLRAYRSWHTFEQGTDCRRWLGTICRNTFRELRHRADRVVPMDDDGLESLAAAYTHIAARNAGLDDMYARLDLGPAIATAIDALDPGFRDVVVLADVHGLQYDEVADALAIPIGTVRSRLYRARRQLQEMLMAYAIDAGYGTARPESAR
ncbi:MAG TPA: sigma-70 family RNA polymerase sigma factor, partial [Gemmatimonadaceae bacterium]|nr:sigma-70 family RNA polymerase sigma factor [Gemmatimonadaceae bacterium]